MGAPATRITAEDFLIPPELRACNLAANAAGRIGGVRLRLAAHACKTRLVESYQQIPLQVLPPFQVADNEPALVYLLNPTAGLMDGDAQLIRIHAESGTRSVITGQSATRIHPSIHGFATQQWHITVAPGATLVVLPGPAIPFRHCRYYQRAEIELSKGAGLVWGDIWFAGRYARRALSEQFQFSILLQEVTIRREQCPIFRDRFCWRGPWDEQTARWHFGGSLACGSLFVTGSLALPEPRDGCVRALFKTAAGDTCLRWHGRSEVVTQALVEAALHAGAELAAGGGNQPWLLRDGSLAPNHWFSSMLASDA